MFYIFYIDFLDQDYLWWQKFDETMPSFVNMNNPKGYQYLDNQGLAKSMGDILKAVEKPTEERVYDTFEKVVYLFRANCN